MTSLSTVYLATVGVVSHPRSQISQAKIVEAKIVDNSFPSSCRRC